MLVRFPEPPYSRLSSPSSPHTPAPAVPSPLLKLCRCTPVHPCLSWAGEPSSGASAGLSREECHLPETCWPRCAQSTPGCCSPSLPGHGDISHGALCPPAPHMPICSALPASQSVPCDLCELSKVTRLLSHQFPPSQPIFALPQPENHTQTADSHSPWQTPRSAQSLTPLH